MSRFLLTRFRLKPHPERPEYFDVRISRDKLAMYADYRRVTDEHEGVMCKFDAITQPWKRFIHHSDGQVTIPPDLGAILFYLGGIDPDLVAHAMTHASLNYLERVEHADWTHLTTDTVLRERLCDVQGRLVGTFWEKWRAAQTRLARSRAT